MVALVIGVWLAYFNQRSIIKDATLQQAVMNVKHSHHHHLSAEQEHH